LHRIASFAPDNNKPSLLARRNFLLSASSAAHDEKNVPSPPVPFRDENDFVLAGELPDEVLHSTSPPLIRQSKSSTNPLLSPARKIPNPYGWMRDDSRKNTTVLDYLREENEYTRVMTKHLEELQEELYNEFINSIEETDYTTPVADGEFWYYSRFIEGLSYPIYCRAPREEGELYHPPINERWNEKGTTPFDMQPLLPGEVAYLNLPQMAQSRTYLALGVNKISPNDQYVAYSLDELGDEVCHLYVKHIESDKEWILYDGDDILEGDGSICWDGKGKAIFYCTLDATRRSHRLYRRQLFDDEGNYIDAPKQHDELMFEEKDATFSLRISKSFDSRYLVLTCSAKESTELHYLDLQQEVEGKTVAEQLKCISKREEKLCYRVTHCFGYWLVQTNNKGNTPNLSLKACKVGEEKDATCWLDVVTSSKIGSNSSVPIFDGGNERSLDGITIFSPNNNDVDAFTPFAYGVATGREDGMPRVWILEFTEEGVSSKASPLKVTKSCRLEFDESAYDVGIGGNRDNSLPYVVISYDSLVTPPSHIAIPLNNPNDFNARKVLKEKQVDGYDKELFACERFTVKSRDGVTEIPVSMVFQRDAFAKNKGKVPTHLYGYGSYGASIEASFRSIRLPLLKRGVVYVLAHVRGGGELGRPWYEEPNGKYLGKKNSFNDFVDIARWLTDETSERIAADEKGRGITIPSKLSCEGKSAGGCEYLSTLAFCISQWRCH
jgi:oligopeptidase B